MSAKRKSTRTHLCEQCGKAIAPEDVRYFEYYSLDGSYVDHIVCPQCRKFLICWKYEFPIKNVETGEYIDWNKVNILPYSKGR